MARRLFTLHGIQVRCLSLSRPSSREACGGRSSEEEEQRRKAVKGLHVDQADCPANEWEYRYASPFLMHIHSLLT